MRKFKFIGSVDYAGFKFGGMYEYDAECPEKHRGTTKFYIDLYPDDWEEVFDEEIVEDALKVEYHGSGYSDTYYQGDKNILSISGTFGDVVFSLSGNFEKCLTVLDFISSLEVEKK